MINGPDDLNDLIRKDGWTRLGNGAVKGTWPDDERTFCLRIGELRELESARDASAGELLQRIARMHGRIDDLREVIRLGLIGGGLSAVKALGIVQRCVTPGRLAECSIIAAYVLSAAMYGEEKENTPGETQAEEPTSRIESISRPSTDQARPSDSILAESMPARSTNSRHALMDGTAATAPNLPPVP